MYAHWQFFVPFLLCLGGLCAVLSTRLAFVLENHSVSGHTLQEIGRPLAHSRVDKGFGGLDVVVEVVPECLDMRDHLGSSLEGEMAGEKDWQKFSKQLGRIGHGAYRM